MHANMRLKRSARSVERDTKRERESARSFDILVRRLTVATTTTTHVA